MKQNKSAERGVDSDTQNKVCPTTIIKRFVGGTTLHCHVPVELLIQVFSTYYANIEVGEIRCPRNEAKAALLNINCPSVVAKYKEGYTSMNAMQ